MVEAPLAFAFTAGLVASVNPCGFPMLPAYLSYFMGIDSAEDAGVARLPRAVGAAASVSLGFFAVFVALGVPVNAGLTSIYRAIPWLTIVIGGLLAVLGTAMLAGYNLSAALPKLNRGGRSRRFGSMVVFGVSYGIASLSCTLPVFLTVVAGTWDRENVLAGFVAFLTYALGMASVLLVLSVALALTRDSIVHRLRRALPYVNRVAGALLIVVGAYLVYYWVFNLANNPSDPIGSSPIAAVDDLSSQLAAWLQERGTDVAGWLRDGAVRAALLVVTVAAAAGATGFARRRAATQETDVVR